MKGQGHARRGSESEPQAVALRYDAPSDQAPEVLARGRGEIAERILELARREGVPIRTDADLVRALAVCEVGTEIPAELYAAVAALIAALWRIDGEPERGQGPRA